jgi:hypothetical protein
VFLREAGIGALLQDGSSKKDGEESVYSLHG